MGSTSKKVNDKMSTNIKKTLPKIVSMGGRGEG